jgi:pimeloyl-ACP methyl ester carboxylesterase
METFIADDGEPLHLRTSGSGTPILFLHGWTSSHTVWRPLLEGLTPHHRLLRPDARGHGGHHLRLTQTPDVARLARDVENLLDHYGLEKLAVVGHSMGALTLWQYIRDHGCERLSHICIIDQSPKLVTDATWANGIYGDFDAARSQALLDDLETDFAEAVLRLIAHGLNARSRETYDRNSSGWQESRKNLQQLDPQPQIAIWKSLVAADYRDVMPLIKVPTLLSFGAQSNFYTAATAQYLLTHIANAQLSCYEKADHCPQLIDPLRFTAELLEFLALPNNP